MSLIPRKKLTDILNGGAENLRATWDKTEAAGEFAPLPKGEYVCRIISGELRTNKNQTPEYCLTFKVLEGEHAARQIWHSVYLTPAALAMAKRDLAKLGVTTLEQLENPLPPGIRCKVKLALRTGNDGAEFNRVKSFEVVGIDKTDDDDFAPRIPAPSPEEPKPAPTSATEALFKIEPPSALGVM